MQIIVFSYKYNGPLKPLVGEADIVHLPVSTRGKASKEKTIKGFGGEKKLEISTSISVV